MKQYLLATCSVLLALSSNAPLAARPAGRPSVDQASASANDDLMPFAATPRRIKLGMTASEVVAAMRGQPDDKMTEREWIYWDFAGQKRPAAMKQPALIVFFAGGRVSDIRYTEAVLVRQTLAEYRVAAARAAGAAK